MDPISTSASILTVLGAAGGTCNLLHNFILDLKDAPHDIRLQNKKLQCLSSNIACLLRVCNKLPQDLQLDAHLQGVHEFIQDIDLINANLQQRGHGLAQGKVPRLRESCRWLLFDRHMKKFFNNLEHYNIAFSHALWAAQLSLLMRISEQQAPATPPCIDSSPQPEIYPVPSPTPLKSNSDPPLTINRALARLQHMVETVGMHLQGRNELQLGAVQLDVRHGPAVTRRWDKIGKEVYTTEGYTLSVTIESIKYASRRLTLMIAILYGTAHIPHLSVRWNLHFSPVVPLDNSAFEAVRLGDIDHVIQILSSGSLGITAATPGGYTLLHFAARYGRTEILSLLVENGANVNSTNDRGETPLHIAMKQGHDLECTRSLLAMGADPCQPDTEGRTPMHIFYNAVTAYMFRHHLDDIDIWAQDSKGMTALHYLAWSRRSTPQDLIRCMEMDGSSKRKIHFGIASQLSIKDAQGKSVLHCAVQRGNLDLIEYLISRPDAATLSMPDHSGRTLLHYATESSRTDIIDLFLSRGFCISAVDKKGRTVSHHACQWGNLKAVKHLVDLGFESQLDVLDHDHMTPMQLAELYSSKAVVEYLRELRPCHPVAGHEIKRRDIEVWSCATSISERHVRPFSYVKLLAVLSFTIFASLVLKLLYSICSRRKWVLRYGWCV